MRTDLISNNGRIFAAKIYKTHKAGYQTEEGNDNKAKDVLKPLECDTLTFRKNKKNEKAKKPSKTPKMPKFVHSALLNMGQKRAQKLEAQAKAIEEDAAEAIGFSYVGGLILHSRQTITDGVETNGSTKTTSQVYNYKDGVLTHAELDITENLNSGTKTVKQIFEFEGGKLSAVYENVTKFPDGTSDFSKKFKADKKGHLKCVYNKIF